MSGQHQELTSVSSFFSVEHISLLLFQWAKRGLWGNGWSPISAQHAGAVKLNRLLTWLYKAEITLFLQMKKLRPREVIYLELLSLRLGFELISDGFCGYPSRFSQALPFFIFILTDCFMHFWTLVVNWWKFRISFHQSVFQSAPYIDNFIEFYFLSPKLVWGVKAFKGSYLRALLSDYLHIIKVQAFLNTGQLKLII